MRKPGTFSSILFFLLGVLHKEELNTADVGIMEFETPNGPAAGYSGSATGFISAAQHFCEPVATPVIQVNSAINN